MNSENDFWEIVNDSYREEKHMYCKVCGNPLRDNDAVCTVCGTAVEKPSKWADRKPEEGSIPIAAQELEEWLSEESEPFTDEPDESRSEALPETPDEKPPFFVFPEDDNKDETSEESADEQAETTIRDIAPEFTWNVYDFPKPRRTEDIRFDWGVADEKKEQAPVAAEEEAETELKNDEDDLLNEEESKADKALNEACEEAKQLFSFDQKNEAFQELLDREYDKMKDQDPKTQDGAGFLRRGSLIEPDIEAEELGDDKRIDFSELYCAPIKEIESAAPRYAKDPIPVYIAGLAPETVATLREIKGTTGEPAPFDEEDRYATVKTIEIPAVKELAAEEIPVSRFAEEPESEIDEETETPTVEEPETAINEEPETAAVEEAETPAEGEEETTVDAEEDYAPQYILGEVETKETETEEVEDETPAALPLDEEEPEIAPVTAPEPIIEPEAAPLDENTAEEQENLPPLWFEQKDGEEQEEEKKKHGIGRILLILVIVILLVEIATLAVKLLAPDSDAAAAVTKAQVAVVGVFIDAKDSVTGLFGISGDDGGAAEESADLTESGITETEEEDGSEETPEATETQKAEEETEVDTTPAKDKTTLIEAASESNKNVKSVKADTSLAYKAGRDYGLSDINHSVALTENVLRKTSDGETVLIDREIVKTLIAFDSQWIDYVNGGSDAVVDLTKKGSVAYENAVNYSKVGKIKETFDVLSIGDIRKGSDGYYVWTYEEITKTENGKTTEISYHWIYYLEAVDGEMKIVNYIKY